MRALQFRPPEELYDLEADPYEMNNLADDPAQAEVLETLRGKVRAWMLQQGDDGGSAYHGEEGRARRFLDEFYGRQVVVNARMYYDTNEAATLELICPVWQAEIRFTLDGSEPTRGVDLVQRAVSRFPRRPRSRRRRYSTAARRPYAWSSFPISTTYFITSIISSLFHGR